MFDLMFSSKSKNQKSANKSTGKSNSKKDKENLIMDAAAREVTLILKHKNLLFLAKQTGLRTTHLLERKS